MRAARRDPRHPDESGRALPGNGSSVGETPTGATGTVALPGKSLMIGALVWRIALWSRLRRGWKPRELAGKMPALREQAGRP
jgi:hypothetical protein